MLFNNSSNKIRIIGFLVSEVKIINAYAIEFLIAVPRKVKKGEQGFNDVFTVYNVPLVKTQMKKIIVTAKTLYSHPKNVSKIYAALHTDLAW